MQPGLASKLRILFSVLQGVEITHVYQHTQIKVESLCHRESLQTVESRQESWSFGVNLFFGYLSNYFKRNQV